MEADAPLAFTFEEKSLSRRPELQQRFQRVVEIRPRQTCLSPHVHCPHLHPPTLASQVNERFRERTRLFHRHEILGQQLEVFERTYEAIGRRSSDFIQSRIGHMLEWIIIVLLVSLHSSRHFPPPRCDMGRTTASNARAVQSALVWYAPAEYVSS